MSRDTLRPIAKDINKAKLFVFVRMEDGKCEYFPVNAVVHGKKVRSPRIVFNDNAIFDLSHVPKDLSAALQLPTACDILGRYLFLTEVESSKIANVKTKIANEIETCWIHLNVYPLSRIRIHKKVSDFVDDFRYIKCYWNDSKRSKQKRFNTCCKNVHTALAQPGFDIRTQDKARIEQLESKYDIKMTEDDEKFLEDNIRGKRKMSATLDVKWVRMKQDEERKTAERDEKRRKMSEELEKQRSLYDKTSYEYYDIDQEEKSGEEE